MPNSVSATNESSHFFPKGLPSRPSPLPRPVRALPSQPFRESSLAWFWGAGRLMAPVMEELKLAARHDIHTLLIGETGSGKEVIAREIHRMRCERLRKDEQETPFVAINCAAIPEGLAESVLFGHERGAFTSAREKQPGRFEQAQGGTLFLDEVQNLSLAVQAKLLRVIQTGELDRLGSKKSLKMDCKIIAASNVPLDLLVDRGLFRKDLYFRLSIAPILIPALRSRGEDIPVVAQKLSEYLSRKYEVPAKKISEPYLKALQAYLWPGNLRELEHALLYSLLKSSESSEFLQISDLPPNVSGKAKDFISEGAWDTASLENRKTPVAIPLGE